MAIELNAAARLLALTEKQKQLDINGDGEISSDDLKRLRNGEKPVDAAVDKSSDAYQRGLKKRGLDKPSADAARRDRRRAEGRGDANRAAKGR